MAVSIAVLPGDGIGPEITVPTLEILSRLGSSRHPRTIVFDVKREIKPLTDRATRDRAPAVRQ